MRTNLLGDVIVVKLDALKEGNARWDLLGEWRDVVRVEPFVLREMLAEERQGK